MDGAMYGLKLPFPIILISLIGQLGSAARPVVTFNPDWNKIHTGQSITMTCNVEPPATLYYWYRNNNYERSSSENYVTFVAWTGDSGDYKCGTSTRGTSEIVTLSVVSAPVILQAPLYIYEGDNISLRCSSPPRSLATQAIFYRNNQTISKFTTSDTLQLKYTDLKATYSCSRQVLTAISRTYSAETTISYTENAGTIPVTITPDWNKLLTGDNITMTCNGGNKLTYHWLHNGKVVAEGQTYTITSAQVGHSGNYQCQTIRGNSLPFSLEVSDDLFSKPNITMLYPVTEGDNMTLTCVTSLSPIRHGTELQFAFYRDGREVQKFGSSHQYEVQSTLPKDSGNYFCEVRTPTNSVIKRSEELYFQIQGENHKTDYTTVNIIRLALSGCVLFLGCVFLIHHIKTEVITPSKK